MSEAGPIYARVEDGDRLSMGEILGNVVERQVVTGEATDAFESREEEHTFAVVVSQDCDLEQDAHARRDDTMDQKRRENALVAHVLLLVASDQSTVRAKSISSAQWTRVTQNKDERYQFLSSVPVAADRESAGLPALVLDFKRLFSFPTDELLRRIACREIRRRSRLATPYAEHLGVRFGFFLQRIGLVKEHHDAEREVSQVGGGRTALLPTKEPPGER